MDMGSHYHQTLRWPEYTLALVKAALCPAIFIMLRQAVMCYVALCTGLS